MATKKDPTIPVIPPQDAVTYNERLRRLLLDYRNIIQMLPVQRAALLAQFQSSQAQIGRNRTLGLVQAAGNSAERGVVGSSDDLRGRIDVKAAAAQQLADALTVKNIGIQGLNITQQQAEEALRNGQMDISMEQAAEQQTMANQNFLNGLIPGGPGPDQGGGTGNQGSSDQLNRVQSNLSGLFQRFALSSPSEQAGILAQIQRVWNARNSILRSLGMGTYGNDQLVRMIAQVRGPGHGEYRT